MFFLILSSSYSLKFVSFDQVFAEIDNFSSNFILGSAISWSREVEKLKSLDREKTHKAVFQRESGKVKALNLRIALTTPLRGHYRFPQFYLKASLASSNKLPRLKCVFLQIVLYIMYTIRSENIFAEKD